MAEEGMKNVREIEMALLEGMAEGGAGGGGDGEETKAAEHFVLHESELRLVCRAEGAVDSNVFLLHQGHPLLDASAPSVSHNIASFQPEHSGRYECQAVRPDGSIQTKLADLHLQVKDNFDASAFGMVPCSESWKDFCQNGGSCYSHPKDPDALPVCRCAPGYTGQECQFGYSTDAGFEGRVATVLGALFLASLLAIALVIVILHLKRRRQVREYLEEGDAEGDEISQSGLLSSSQQAKHRPQSIGQLFQSSQLLLPSIHRSLQGPLQRIPRQRSSPSHSSISSVILNAAPDFIRQSRRKCPGLMSENEWDGVDEAEEMDDNAILSSPSHDSTLSSNSFLPHSL